MVELRITESNGEYRGAMPVDFNGKITTYLSIERPSADEVRSWAKSTYKAVTGEDIGKFDEKLAKEKVDDAV